MDFQFQSPIVFNKKRQYSLTADDVVELTPKGKQLAEEEAFSGATAQVLLTLNDRGGTTIKELSSDTGIPIDKVKAVVANLMSKAAVRKVGYEG